ncbi:MULTISPECIES: FAS1-like dehydratase domain-containing protein [Nocardia]|uniref:FAS1-like dehydratase domain-containing protein n=1 Tax=Nocardia abscessus TaxID=120957 RepID=UPI0018936B45|nr:MaoC family dehydratase N-terminal domain-containing protein [Nocardia abscessus]MBF6472502.1 MaoC family dehydratase N-terminal domain-containing protein [Nocardia abscessus]
MVDDNAGHDGVIKDEDVAQARKLCGHFFAERNSELYTAAHADAMRNFARGYGDDNPLYTDDEYGVGTVWKSQIAPPLIGVAVNKTLLGDPRPADLRRPAFRGVHNFVSGTEWELYRPVRPGDTLYAFQGYESVEEKESEFAGRTLIIRRRHVRMNQDGEVVSVARVILIHAERKAARSRKKYAVEPAVYTAEDIARIDETYAAEERRGAETRWFEDVEVGDKLGPVAKGPLTTTDIIVFHAGGYGFTPFAPTTGRLAYRNRQRIAPFYVTNAQGIPDVAQRVHWDSEWAQQVGAPVAYDYGVMRDCWLSHLVTDWMGDEAWLLRQSSEIRKFNYMGDWHALTGEVTAKRIEDGRPVVDLALRGVNQRGENTCPATATVLLPSRRCGAVRLPAVPADLADEAARMMRRHHELRAAARAALSPGGVK